MSFIAQRPVRPADSDVTDVDDGGAQITVSTFWPTVKLHDLRLAARIAGDITTSRLMHMATEATLHVADQLKDWRRQREADGAESLASVLLTSAGDPVELINGESAKVYRFRRAVYSFTRASVLEGYKAIVDAIFYVGIVIPGEHSPAERFPWQTWTDLSETFADRVVRIGSQYGVTGGSNNVKIEADNLPPHWHRSGDRSPGTTWDPSTTHGTDNQKSGPLALTEGTYIDAAGLKASANKALDVTNEYFTLRMWIRTA